MDKPFYEALRDSFTHITQVSDPVALAKMREDGILIDTEGYYVFSFGEHKEYELRVEPIGEEQHYAISLYKNAVLLVHKLMIWTDKNESR